jgi:2'-5' RNA ligase
MVAVYIKEPYASQLQAITANVLGSASGAEIMPTDYLHITLAYIGEVDTLEDKNPGTKEKIIRALEEVTEEYRTYQSDDGWCGAVNGIARFYPLDDEMETPLVFTFDSSCMARWRAKIVNAIENQLANIDESHGFFPHITTAYISRYTPMPDIRFPPIDMTISEVCLEWGDERYTFCLRDEITYTPTTSADSMLMVYKAAKTGLPRWLAVSSTSFQDRDREWVSAKSLQEDETRSDLLVELIGTKEALGPVRWAHVGFPYLAVPDDWTSAVAGPGIDLGWCDFSTVHVTEKGTWLVESGTFVDQEVADVIASKASKLGLSLTFAHPSDQPGPSKTFRDIRKVERSFMLRDMPSNLGTFMSVSTKEVKVDRTKIDQLIELGVSPIRVKGFLDQIEQRQAELVAAGIVSKEAGGAPASEADALVQGLDSMMTGVMALKEYVLASKTPKVAVEEEEEGDKKAPPFVKKEAGSPAFTLKELTDGLTQWQTGFVEATRALLADFTTKMAQASQVPVADITSKQASFETTMQSVAGDLQKLTTFMEAAMGDLPPGLVSKEVTSNVKPGDPLHQQQPEASFAEGPFAWLDQKMFGDPESTQARVDAVNPR